MQEMKEFVSFFVAQIPAFLMAEPISAFTGLAILSVVAVLFRRIINL